MKVSDFERGKEKALSFRITFLARQLFLVSNLVLWEVFKKPLIILDLNTLLGGIRGLTSFSDSASMF